MHTINNKLILISHIKNLSYSQFPLVQKQSLLIIEESIGSKNGIKQLIKELAEIDFEELTDLINKFCSIPDYVTIIYQEKAPEFDLKQFFKNVIDEIFILLSSYECDVYIKIIANLISTFFVKGHSNAICDYLNFKLNANYNLARTFSKLLDSVSLKHFENVLQNLIILIQSKDSVRVMCENITNSILQTKFVFICQKMIFFQFYESDFIVTNLSLLLNQLSIKDRKMIFKDVLALWSDEKSIIKIPFNQHFYLSKILLLIFRNFDNDTKQSIFADDNLSLLLRGISLHLLQPVKNYPLVGMVVAEILSKYCYYKSENPLNFEYIDTEETRILKKLIDTEESIAVIDETKETSTFISVNAVDDGDISDDSDFEPINTVFDNEKKLTKRPYYVRDCFDGLSKTKPEDTEYFTACLYDMVNLIYNCPEASVEEAVEFTRQLLHLNCEYEIENFSDKQRNGLIALCSLAPVKVSKYLSDEFFNEHNGLVVRYTILHVITKTAQKLSGFSDLFQPSSLKITSEAKLCAPIISDRPKTRYFFKRRTEPVIESVNLFNECCTYFFYPLLSGVNRTESFDLLNSDYDLLSRFVYTLGIVIHCSVHCVGFKSMIGEYLLFLKSLRTHEMVCVRRAVHVCFGICLISIGGASHSIAIIDDLIESFTEWQLWLRHANDNVTFELDYDCSSLMEKNLGLLRDLIISSASLLQI